MVKANSQLAAFISGSSYLPWWPSCLDRGALINVDAPGSGIRQWFEARLGTSRKVFILGVPKGFLA